MTSMVVAGRGGLATRLRLALARSAVWCGWEFAYLMVCVLVRKDHPYRVFLKGSRTTTRSIQLDALRSSTGPRLSGKARWRLTAIVALGVIFVLKDGVGITGVGL